MRINADLMMIDHDVVIVFYYSRKLEREFSFFKIFRMTSWHTV